MTTADPFWMRELQHARGEGHSQAPVNVGESERMASKVGGGALVAVGLWRGGLGGLTLAALGGALLYRGMTGYCGLYDAIGANTAESEHDDSVPGGVPAQAGVRVEESITINRAPEAIYAFWRNYANIPKFQRSIESVTQVGADPSLSHWVARFPGGLSLEWDAVIHNEDPGRMLAWRSVEGSQLQTAGSVHFDPAPGGRGTEVRVNQKFNPPGGKLAVLAAKVFGADPATETRENLRRLKQLMEAGEVATSGASPSSGAGA